MPPFTVRSRVTTPIAETTLDAKTREDAIQQTVSAAPEGSEVEVMNVEPVPAVPTPVEETDTGKALPPPA